MEAKKEEGKALGAAVSQPAPKKEERKIWWGGLILFIIFMAIACFFIFKGTRTERFQKAEQERFRNTAQIETSRITQRVGNNVETWMVAFGGLLPEINKQINYYRNAKLSDIQKSKLRERILINEQALFIIQDSITVQIKRNIDKGMELK